MQKHIIILPKSASLHKRVFAFVFDAMLIFLLCLFIIDHFLIPQNYSNAMLQFRLIFETNQNLLVNGELTKFFTLLNDNAEILKMFKSIDNAVFFIIWIYYVISYLLFNCGTIGKQIFNLKILKKTNCQSMTILENIIRSGFLSLFLVTAVPFVPILNLCFMCLNKLHCGFHDMLCKTYVVCIEAKNEQDINLKNI